MSSFFLLILKIKVILTNEIVVEILKIEIQEKQFLKVFCKML